MLKLTPNVYKGSPKCSLLGKNRIDTMRFNPIVNTEEQETSSYTVSLKNIRYQGKNITLPIEDDIDSVYWRSVNNATLTSIISGVEEYAKSRIECIVANGVTSFELTEPLVGTPALSIAFNGKSVQIERGKSTYDSYPSINELSDETFNLASWINTNKTTVKESLQVDYSGTSFALNPWVRNIVSNNPTANDVYTDWIISHDAFNESYPKPLGWSEVNNFDDIFK